MCNVSDLYNVCILCIMYTSDLHCVLQSTLIVWHTCQKIYLRLATSIVRERIINSWIDWFVRESPIYERFCRDRASDKCIMNDYESQKCIWEYTLQNPSWIHDSLTNHSIHELMIFSRTIDVAILKSVYDGTSSRIVHEVTILSRTNQFMNWWFSHERFMSRVSKLYKLVYTPELNHKSTILSRTWNVYMVCMIYMADAQWTILSRTSNLEIEALLLPGWNGGRMWVCIYVTTSYLDLIYICICAYIYIYIRIYIMYTCAWIYKYIYTYICMQV